MTSPGDAFDPASMFAALNENNVDYVVVGGYAVLLHTDQYRTYELDFLVEQSRTNLARVSDALESLEARRVTYEVDLPVPDFAYELTEKVESFQTRDGGLDIMRDVDGLGDYRDVSPRTHVVFVEDQDITVIDLDALIASKEAVGRQKDLDQLGFLYVVRDKLVQEELSESLSDDHEVVVAARHEETPQQREERRLEAQQRRDDTREARTEKHRQALEERGPEQDEPERSSPAPEPDYQHDHDYDR